MKGYKENGAGREPGKYRDPIAGNVGRRERNPLV